MPHHRFMAIEASKTRRQVSTSPVENIAERVVRLVSQWILLSSVTIVAALGGTVSPQLSATN
jgi:hypothetical protein